MYRGISGNEYDKYVERFDNRSTLSRVQQSFWEAKQSFLQRIVKQEDDCIIAYDAELDAKLELFKSIVETCQRLLCVIEGYQDRICILAHEESCIGRFLKECGRVNKNLVGKMLTATGKTFYYSAQQRIQLRNPLINLYQNLETFQFKAITDTLITIEQMQKERTSYRASLLWMKSLSSKLDPDSYPELEKFRKVQNHVRKTKQKYDKKKIDCIQKVDMLNASRCNMLSQTLGNYQAAWLTFWSNTAFTISSISNCFEGCQLYESTEIVNLDRASDQNNKNDLINKIEEQSKNDDEQDLLLLGEEAEETKLKSDLTKTNSDLIKMNSDLTNPNNLIKMNSDLNTIRQQKEDQLGKEIDLINIDDSLDLDLFSDNEFNAKISQEQQIRKKQVDDLLTTSADSEDLILLNDILNWSSSEASFTNSLLGQTNQFFSFKNETQSTPFSFSKKEEQTSNSGEKKKWADLFSDLDVFNKKGDC